MQKSMMFRFAILSFLLPAAGLAGCENSSPEDGAAVAASNSFLECVAKDLLGEATPVLRLTEPGMCPGHFDIRPSQVQRLRTCRVLLQFDFQKNKIAGVEPNEAGLKIVPIHIPGGLCEPASYLAACKQAANALVAAGLLDKEKTAERLRHIDTRISRLIVECRRDVAPLKNTPVVCSVHQEAFCTWLGLDVVGTFRGADVESIKRLEKTLRAGKDKHARLVIANRPEGRRCADFLAERLDAKVAVFDNFPAMNDGQNSFDDMLRSNVFELIKASGAERKQ